MKRLLSLLALTVLCSPSWSQTTWVQRSGPTSLTRWTYASHSNGKVVFQSENQNQFNLILIKPQTSAYKFKKCLSACQIEAWIGSDRQMLLADPYDEHEQFIYITLNRNQQDDIKNAVSSSHDFRVKMPYQASMSNEIRVNLNNSKIGAPASQIGSPFDR